MDPVYKRRTQDKRRGSPERSIPASISTLVSKVCATVKKCAEMGVEVGIVIGGGNFWRGVMTARARSSASAPTGWVCLQPA